eukprot:scaffold133082_cov72-Phaeocystis_antarctica.AAC.1
MLVLATTWFDVRDCLGWFLSPPGLVRKAFIDYTCFHNRCTGIYLPPLSYIGNDLGFSVEKPPSSPQGEVVQYKPLRSELGARIRDFGEIIHSPQITSCKCLLHRQLQKSAQRAAGASGGASSVHHDVQDWRTACALCTDMAMTPRR